MAGFPTLRTALLDFAAKVTPNGSGHYAPAMTEPGNVLAGQIRRSVILEEVENFSHATREDFPATDSLFAAAGLPALLLGAHSHSSGFVMRGLPEAQQGNVTQVISDIYRDHGALTTKIGPREIASPYIGVSARKLDAILQKILVGAQKRSVPSLVSIDGSALSSGNPQVERYEAATFDVIKKYTQFPELVFAILDPDSRISEWEIAMLTRSGRLYLIHP